MNIDTLSQRQIETHPITTDHASEPKPMLESRWIYLGGERVCQWIMVER